MQLICHDCGAIFTAQSHNNIECPECGGRIAVEYEPETPRIKPDMTASELMEAMYYGDKPNKGKYN